MTTTTTIDDIHARALDARDVTGLGRVLADFARLVEPLLAAEPSGEAGELRAHIARQADEIYDRDTRIDSLRRELDDRLLQLAAVGTAIGVAAPPFPEVRDRDRWNEFAVKLPVAARSARSEAPSIVVDSTVYTAGDVRALLARAVRSGDHASCWSAGSALLKRAEIAERATAAGAAEIERLQDHHARFKAKVKARGAWLAGRQAAEIERLRAALTAACDEADAEYGAGTFNHHRTAITAWQDATGCGTPEAARQSREETRAAAAQEWSEATSAKDAAIVEDLAAVAQRAIAMMHYLGNAPFADELHGALRAALAPAPTGEG